MNGWAVFYAVAIGWFLHGAVAFGLDQRWGWSAVMVGFAVVEVSWLRTELDRVKR
jgi:hypothetical protein